MKTCSESIFCTNVMNPIFVNLVTQLKLSVRAVPEPLGYQSKNGFNFIQKEADLDASPYINVCIKNRKTVCMPHTRTIIYLLELHKKSHGDSLSKKLLKKSVLARNNYSENTFVPM